MKSNYDEWLLFLFERPVRPVVCDRLHRSDGLLILLISKSLLSGKSISTINMAISNSKIDHLWYFRKARSPISILRKECFSSCFALMQKGPKKSRKKYASPHMPSHLPAFLPGQRAHNRIPVSKNYRFHSISCYN